jgi:hypothetical protein
MTAHDLIEALKQFPPSDEIEVEFNPRHSKTMSYGDIDFVIPNNGARRRILIRSNED